MSTKKPEKEKKVINMWGEEEYKKDPRYNHPSADKTHHNYNPKNFQMFGPNKIALGIELREHHTELCEMIVAKHGLDNFELMLAEIAAYFEIILDGTYTEEDVEKLCGILLTKLVQHRTPMIFPEPKGEQ